MKKIKKGIKIKTKNEIGKTMKKTNRKNSFNEPYRRFTKLLGSHYIICSVWAVPSLVSLVIPLCDSTTELH